MKTINLGLSGLKVPAIAIGCMRINGISKPEAEGFIKTALDLGLNFFDHADIYGGGSCESIFAEAIGMNPAIREKIILQSKCSIKPGSYDFSKKHILDSVENSLKRLKTDYLDVMLLHRPDTLMEGEEVAEAFDLLHNSGKVRNFGVSNHNPSQIRLLKKYLHQNIAVNQLQLSITHAGMITQGFQVNMGSDGAVDRDGGILEYCRLEDITIQSWSPFQYGFFGGTFIGSDKYPELNKKLEELGKKYSVSPTAIVIAWFMRHPAGFQVVSGTMKSSRIKECAAGMDINLTREEWYAIYLSAGNILP
jgi:predicted oxidoreductase